MPFGFAFRQHLQRCFVAAVIVAAMQYENAAGFQLPTNSGRSHKLPSLVRLGMSEPSFFDDEPAEPVKDERGATQPSIDEIAAASEFEEHIPRVNSVTLTGRVGNDPEPRYFDDGKVVLNLSLACKRKYHPLQRKVRNIKYGEEETDWFTLELWGRDAEYANNFVTKGARIGITGSIVKDEWTDRATGEPRSRHKVQVKHMDILESKAEADLRRGNSGRSYGGGGTYGGGGNTNYDDDGGPEPAGTGGFFD
jgi:single-strand DNA-binding protein